MKSKIVKVEIHSVALNHLLPDFVVNDIVESAFHMVNDMIESSNREAVDFPTISLINFGKFYVSDQKKEYLKKRN